MAEQARRTARGSRAQAEVTSRGSGHRAPGATLIAVGQVDLVGVARAQVLQHAPNARSYPAGRLADSRVPGRSTKERPSQRSGARARRTARRTPHPHRVRPAPQGRAGSSGRRRTRGSPPSARPGLRVAGDLLLEHGEDVVAHDLVAAVRCRVTSPCGGVEAQRDVVVVEDADERAAAPTSCGPRRRRARTPGRCGRPRRARPRSSSWSGAHAQEVPDQPAPCCDRIDSGWNCTPSSGSVAVAHRHHHAVAARRHARGRRAPRSPASEW